MKVIHGHQQWPAGGQLAQQVQQAEGQRARCRWLTSGVGAQQRYLQPPALRRRQATQHHRFYPVQQVSQAGERQARLRAVRPGRQHRHSTAQRRVPPRLPQRRLTHPGTALEHQGRAVGRTGDELSQDFELRLTPDDPRNAFPSRRMHHTPNLSPAASAVSRPAGNSSTERADPKERYLSASPGSVQFQVCDWVSQ
jgi:hypothetical protein